MVLRFERWALDSDELDERRGAIATGTLWTGDA
jgi:hypothetical protein